MNFPAFLVSTTLFVIGIPSVPLAAEEFDLERTKHRLTRVIKETLADTGIPSISIALLKDDHIVWAEAFGYSNVKLRVPASPNTIYSTGSCFKPVTAMAVMQLAERGKLKLDEPINQYLEEYAIRNISAGPPVTSRHLLAHYSGLTAQLDKVPLWERRTPRSLKDIAAIIKVEHAPGSQYQYSNAGFALAGLLVEQVSGMSFEQYVVQNIFRPLGIESLDRSIRPLK